MTTTQDKQAMEAVAKAIYEQWVGHPGYKPWVERGNSLMQDKARDIARAALSQGTQAAQPVAALTEEQRTTLRLLRQSNLLRGTEKAAITAALATPAPAQGGREPWIPYLSDRADGVKGHYAIARWNPDGYREVWNLRGRGWGSFSDDALTLDEARDLLKGMAPTHELAAAEVPEVQRTAPERIYLDIGDALEAQLGHMAEVAAIGGDPAPTDDSNISFRDLSEVTWSEDNATGHGIAYVRADLAKGEAIRTLIDKGSDPCTTDGCRYALEGRGLAPRCIAGCKGNGA